MEKITDNAMVIDKETIDQAADKAGMTVPEFLEWGMHAIVNTFTGSEYSPGDANREASRLKKRRGSVAAGIIRQSPVEAFIEYEGMTMEEFTEASILTAIDMVESSEYPEMKPRDILRNNRHERRLLLPEICNTQIAALREEIKVHPFMHRMFSGGFIGKAVGEKLAKAEDAELVEWLHSAKERAAWEEVQVIAHELSLREQERENAA